VAVVVVVHTPGTVEQVVLGAAALVAVRLAHRQPQQVELLTLVAVGVVASRFLRAVLGVPVR
jgi:hypothetical protein